MAEKYAEIVVGRAAQRVDRIFTYRVPEALREKVCPGMMVEAPFGSGGKTVKGYVLALTDTTDVPADKLKELKGLLGSAPVFTDEELDLARFIAKRWGAALSSCLALFVPRDPGKGLKETETVTLGEEPEGRLGARQAVVVEYLKRTPAGRAPRELIYRETGANASVLRSLAEKGIIILSSEPEEKPPADFISAAVRPVLSDEQQDALSPILRASREGRYEGFLLFGITGSGKTEVYLRAAEDLIRRGRTLILLVPEISLTPQYIRILTERFGPRVGVLHSGLTDTERSRRWTRAKEGFYDVVVGPRSALFTPLPSLGMVILDEEHESSYKADEMPAYHAREVAEELCRRRGIPLVLGSATPSVETFHRAKSGGLTLLTMKKRPSGAVLPEVTLVDMRQEAEAGNLGIFSRTLVGKISERLAKGEQTILFLNRKGYAGTVSCRGCGEALRCSRCYLPYTYHKDVNALICHHCGKTVPLPDRCPHCGSPYLRPFGIGTQKVEEEARRLFPEARIRRMDLDSSRGSAEEYGKLVADMAEGRTDILVGTQMVAKGFDFPKVTLVGVVAADTSLFNPDYHSAERTFQLLTQAAGRAGRSETPGEALIQTFAPEEYAIRDAVAQDYPAFYGEELRAREMMGCPPFLHLLQMVVAGPNEDTVRREVAELYQLMAGYAAKRPFTLLGPSPCQLGRVNNVFRWKILVKCAEWERLASYGSYCLAKYLEKEPRSTVSMDLDPSQIS